MPDVLVIDDNQQNRDLAEATLLDEGYSVRLAASGQEGLRAFEEAAPDCILLDVRMPGMDGLAVCERIRALPGGAHTPIVVLTALRDLDVFDKAMQAGADDFLTKPVRPVELILRIRAALKLGSLSAEHSEQTQFIRRQRDDQMRLQLLNERLMAFVVHDLKGPVGTIDLYAQAALLGEEEMAEQTREYLQSIRREVQAVIRLLMNLLDLSKGTEGRLDLKLADIDLSALAEQAVAAQEARAGSHQVKLETDIQVNRIHGDADLLRRVLENLLDNAIRHSPEGSSVRVSAGAQDGAVEIHVADVGWGVPPELREGIFDRFVQTKGSDPSATRSGRGLGLAFCKMVVEAHDGRIWVEDAHPGAIFCMKLPQQQG